jgi:DNA-binding transcriptional LysR family regulator
MDLPLELLCCFQAVAQTQHLTRAAEMLAISQPAVSKQVKHLEKAIGARLIERCGRGIQLTAEGRVLAEYAGRILHLSRQAQEAIGDVKHLRSGSLRMGAVASIAAYVLPDALIRFRQRFGGIRFHLETAGTAVLRELLRDGSIELALSPTPLPAPEFDASVVWTDELLAIVPAGHALSKRRSVGAAELAAYPIVAREAAAEGQLTHVQRVLASANVSAAPAIRLGTTEAVKRAVAVGLGVSIVPRLAIRAEVQSGELVGIKLRNIVVRRPIHVIRRHGSEPTKPAIAMLCLVKHVLRGTLPKRG